ncbi:hypothetical protein, partial [Salmonella enterica]|uniref:hypothetical protein n=1 Tax=Salmonella enterica TaxID=28901 RepID=UPI001654AAB0
MRTATFLSVIVVTAGLVACGSSAATTQEPGPAAPAAAVWTMPEVLGVNALEDENPDPNIVEVTL